MLMEILPKVKHIEEKNKDDKRNRKTTSKDEAQGTVQGKIGAGFTAYPLEVKETIETKMKPGISEMAESKVDVQSMDLSKMDAQSTENLVDRNIAGKRKRKKKRRKKSLNNMTIGNDVQTMVQNTIDVALTENITKGNVTGREGMDGIVGKSTVKEVGNMGEHKLDTGVTENLAAGDVTSMKKKKRKRKAKSKSKAESANQIQMHEESMDILTEGTVSGKRKRKKRRKTKGKDEVQSMDPITMDTSLVENLTEGNESGIKNETISTKATIKDEVNLHNNQMGTMAVGNFALGNPISTRKRKRRGKKRTPGPDEHESMLTGEMTFEPPTQLSELRMKCFPSGNHSPNIPVPSARRKLLVLDVNGLLADVVKPPLKDCRGDRRISGRAICRRPFCDDFLKFCFRNFEVGIWSSISRSHCTQTGFKTLENRHKPLVCKDLRKVWENKDPNSPWKKGAYDESNTLLVDDSPYKALLNPLHTGIFPSPYHHVDKNDNALGPGGEIRVYLEELAKSENVQMFVAQHPFGVKAIDEESPCWEFYAKVLDQIHRSTTSRQRPSSR
ncbi:uncharacterized protein LOC127240391 isoform X2 [Andrographis paniculata]|uniref:uncharacterized protein LOC127240391 isoform X2 n=1 Tax=Andrographis paniculata TaxID=175694 RepID=UPI0021E8EFB4|nr:uncharacterized protein LOC127240391 isoform X2 [Andrographis paniculata]